ncbi:gamma-glutamyltransferase [Peribacillus deserti]|uniref:Glutathione hydrolase proenzyme n=1 Tax=Peribacillus deserti TaxID=673318 RepID=A0A2N5M6R5_9BACI|nr:gamma-glutamyltransferase [Peribacillus deserti]PLT30041.1 gamma-glutamyltransferase [Peribacillus deserti]
MKRVWSVILVFTLSFIFTSEPFTAAAKAGNPNKKQQGYSQVDYGTDGMVATAHYLATEVGANVLKKGGNAVDAAIAIQFALNVVEPMMSGIGGGGFMMVYDAKTKKTTIIDSRERAPGGAKPDMFLNQNGQPIPFDQRVMSGTSVGVPGTLKGLEKAHDRWGTKPMAQLINPSIQLAEKGFSIDSVLAKSIADSKEKLSRTAAKKVFLRGSAPLKEGDKLVQKDLAKTFKLIRSKGSDVFYQGEIGKQLAKTVQEKGGALKLSDLNKYSVTVDQPIWGEYKGYKIASMPPPSSGGVFLLQMLKILDSYQLSQYEVRSWQKYHLLAEAMHLSYADRAAYAGDPEFVNVPLKGLLDPDYIKERQALISMDQAAKTVKAGDPWKYENESPDYSIVPQKDDKKIGQTTHFTVADKWGNTVSYTTTIEQVFGSGIMVPGYGFMLNNELTDFDAVPGGANGVEPYKRPLSSMTPTIVFENNKPVLTVGSPGGPTIIASVLQTILHSLEYDMELKAAVEEPRIYTNNPGNYQREKGIPAETLDKLKQLGHSFGSTEAEIGNVQSILIDHKEGHFKGVADSSRNGASIGIDGKGSKKGSK